MAEERRAYRNAKAKHTQAKAACTRARTFVDDLGTKQVSAIKLQQRQAKLRECWQMFEDAQAHIDLQEMTDEQEIVHEAERQAFEDKYFAADTKFEELIIERTTQVDTSEPNPFGLLAQQGNSNNLQAASVNMRLPRPSRVRTTLAPFLRRVSFNDTRELCPADHSENALF